MTLLKTLVLLDVVEIVSPDDHSAVHLQTLHDPGQNTTTDTNITSKRAFLVDVVTLDCL